MLKRVQHDIKNKECHIKCGVIKGRAVTLNLPAQAGLFRVSSDCRTVKDAETGST